MASIRGSNPTSAADGDAETTQPRVATAAPDPRTATVAVGASHDATKWDIKTSQSDKHEALFGYMTHTLIETNTNDDTAPRLIRRLDR